jgi:hypothetical protein
MSEFPINDNQKYDVPNEDTPINAVIEGRYDITSDNEYMTFSKIPLNPSDIIQVSFDVNKVDKDRMFETFRMVNEVFPDHLVVGVMNSADIDTAKGRDVPLKAEVDVYSGNRDLLCCNCGDKIDIEDKPNYCSGCGQRIDWEGIENEI